ncbi:GPI mannosyltransferase 2 [Prorops nasuta]|uniref:GPI mannosyltransferase 2 n=1 Tax=Prorops nasuta TaxID=863751 RepID=UPI0034CF7ED4
MYTPKEKVLWFAIVTRLAIIFLQAMFNLICPDHKADAFVMPQDPSDESSTSNKIVSFLFAGLTRWDAQYFLYIAKYGYTFENTLAFYPLYPTIVRFMSIIMKQILYGLHSYNILLVSGIILNLFCFIRSTIIFYDLSLYILKKQGLAYKATILYCINPASIFFSAVYSEALFAYITFYVMLASFKNKYYIFVPLGLSAIARSNGLINIGFPIYSELKDALKNVYLINYSLKTIVFKLFRNICCKTCIKILGIIILSLVPFILVQIYNYAKFCSNYYKVPLPDHVSKFGTDNNLILPSNGSSWCKEAIPISYTYIQNKYWNVGFMNYYQLKQIPNFALALPVLFIMAKCIQEFLYQHGQIIFTMGLFNVSSRQKKYDFPLEMFVFIVHGSVLFFTCLFFIHIQVSTRLLCSSSPLIYWYCAKQISYEQRSEDDYEVESNAYSRWKIFFINQNHYSFSDKLILSYFLGYFILGCFMFSNFLPWT